MGDVTGTQGRGQAVLKQTRLYRLFLYPCNHFLI